MVHVEEIPAKQGFLDHIKNFDVSEILKSLKAYPFNWVEIGTCVGIGVLSGFLFKKYFKTFVLTLLFGVIVIAMLDRLHLVHIDWDHVQSVVGVKPTQEAFHNLFQAGYAWVRLNLQAVISFGSGFVVGYKVG